MHFTTLKGPVGTVIIGRSRGNWEVPPPASLLNIPIKPKDVLSNEVTALKLK